MLLRFEWAKHKELWLWLVENPDKQKYDWPGWKLCAEGDIPVQYCYACDFASHMSMNAKPAKGSQEQRQRVLCLKHCPLDWGSGCTCLCARGYDPDPGLYELWGYAFPDEELRSYYARQIANLPLKKWAEAYV